MTDAPDETSDATYAAYETLGDPADAGPFVLTCEHASNALPPGIAASDSDRALLADHWGWDVGARDVVAGLLARLGGQAVVSRFSRLVCDPNRDPGEPTFVVRAIDDQPVTFNAGVDDAEVARRARCYHDAYHRAIDETIAARRALGAPVRLVSIHSFTPMYLGQTRPMEIGVLFDRYDEHAWRLEGALAEQGFASALNAPYTGKPPNGLIYSVHRHGNAHGIEYLELEIRQDLIDAPAKADEVATRVAAALAVFRP